MKKSEKMLLLGASIITTLGGMYYLMKNQISSGTSPPSGGGANASCKVNGDTELYVIINGKKYSAQFSMWPTGGGPVGKQSMVTHYPASPHGGGSAPEQCITGNYNNYYVCYNGACWGTATCNNGYTFSFKILGFYGP